MNTIKLARAFHEASNRYIDHECGVIDDMYLHCVNSYNSDDEDDEQQRLTFFQRQVVVLLEKIHTLIPDINKIRNAGQRYELLFDFKIIIDNLIEFTKKRNITSLCFNDIEQEVNDWVTYTFSILDNEYLPKSPVLQRH